MTPTTHPTTRHSQKGLLALLFGVALMLSTTSVVAAKSETIFVSPYFCDLEGGTVTVQPGTSVVLVAGWGTKTYGQLQDFLQARTWVLVVNGATVDLEPYFFYVEWAEIWNYPDYPGQTLGARESMTVSLDLIASRPTYDGYAHYPAGSLLGGPKSCTITTIR